ncbi:MAG TPA: hypothetical protein PLB38_03030 [bacterium]|nr:hypothetical protein [bacterium]
MEVIVKPSNGHSNMVAKENETAIKRAFEDFFNAIGFRRNVEIILGENVKGGNHLKGLRYVRPEINGQIALCRIQVASNDSNLMVRVYQPFGWNAQDKTWAEFVEKGLEKYDAQQTGAVNNQRVLKKIRKLYRHVQGKDFSFAELTESVVTMLGYKNRASCVSSLQQYAKGNAHVMQLSKQGVFLFCTWTEAFREEMRLRGYGVEKENLGITESGMDDLALPDFEEDSEAPFVDTTTLEVSSEDVPASSSLTVSVAQQAATTFQPKLTPAPPPPTSAEEEKILADILVVEDEIKKLKTLQDELPAKLAEAEATCEETRYELEACREKLAIAEEADRLANEAKSELLRDNQAAQAAIAQNEEKLATLHQELIACEENAKQRATLVKDKFSELLALCGNDEHRLKLMLEQMGLLK